MPTPTAIGQGNSGPDNPRVINRSRLMTFARRREDLFGLNETVDTRLDDDFARFNFRINPSKLQRSRKKVERFILTKFGYERQYWGNDLHTFNYNGTTGVFKPNITAEEYAVRFGDTAGFDIRSTEAWKNFQRFEQFFERNGHRNIYMMYWAYSHEYEGSLDDFRFEHDADRSPYSINYSFKFTGLPLLYTEVEYDITQVTGPLGDFPTTDEVAKDEVAV